MQYIVKESEVWELPETIEAMQELGCYPDNYGGDWIVVSARDEQDALAQPPRGSIPRRPGSPLGGRTGQTRQGGERMAQRKFRMVSDKYGEPHETTPEEFLAGCEELWPGQVSIRWHTDGELDYYTDQDGEIVLQEVKQ